MRVLSPVLLSSFILMVGCVQVITKVTPLGSHRAPAKPESGQLLVLSQFPSERKYEELCIIESKRYVGALKDMLPAINAEACKAGADAIVVKSSAASNGENWAQAHIVAIRFI